MSKKTITSLRTAKTPLRLAKSPLKNVFDDFVQSKTGKTYGSIVDPLGIGKDVLKNLFGGKLCFCENSVEKLLFCENLVEKFFFAKICLEVVVGENLIETFCRRKFNRHFLSATKFE